MPRTEQPVEYFELDYVCDKCGQGHMRPTGICLTSNPPHWPHECNNSKCDAKINFSNIKYPATGYRKIGNATILPGEQI